MKRNNSEKKTTVINFRVTEQQKQRIQENAKAADMSVTQYLSHIAEHHSVVITPGGKDLAEVLYSLHTAIENLAQYPCIPIKKLQDTVSQGVARLYNAMKGVEENVHP